MMKISFRDVEKQFTAWLSSYSENNSRARICISFAWAGEQWNEGIVSSRTSKNKESLTFNHCIKLLKRLKAQSREIEFSLNLSPTNKVYEEDPEETAAFRLIVNNIMLNDVMCNTFSASLDKCCDFGYSFLEVNFDRESQETLNFIPTVVLHEDPSIAFWDKNAPDLFKVKGRFAGIRKLLNRQELVTKYPQLNDKQWVKEKNNVVIDYWYRDYELMEFKLLKTGVYKREDLLSFDDTNNLATDDYFDPDKDAILPKKKKMPLVQKANVCRIYFMRFCGENVIQEPILFPTDDLPLVYHPALRVWIPEKGERTYPYIYHMQGAQKLHNYTLSQAATNAKNISGDKYFFKDEHLETEDQIELAKNINSYEGGIKFGGDISTIRREQPGEISQSMMALAQQSKQEIDEIAGAMTDSQNSDQVVISGVALDKITHNMGIINTDVIGIHTQFVNQVGKLVKQMIPRLYTEERTLVVFEEDGSAQAIKINECLETGEIRNNVKDINNNFEYEITAGPSSVMQKENTLKYLTGFYQISPPLFNLTADIAMRQLDTPDAGELERRVAIAIDPNIIKYSQGLMSEKDFMAYQAQQKQQQQQQQMQMMQADPQMQGMLAMARSEHAKAEAQQYDAQTKRFAAQASAQVDLRKIENDNQKLQLQLAELLQKTQNEQSQKEIDLIRMHMAATQSLLDSINEQQQMQSQQLPEPQQEGEPNAGQQTEV
jgi:murein DD-endopeptidase MepM/ murein hydrolase activator NlpD